MAMVMHLKKGIYKMTFEEAERIILGIVEGAFLNARDVDQDEAKEIDQATTIYFGRIDKLIKEDDKNDKTK